MSVITSGQKLLFEDEQGSIILEEAGLIVADFFPNIEITGAGGCLRISSINKLPGGPFKLLVRHHGPWILTRSVIDTILTELPKNVDRIAVFIGQPELAANALTQKNIFSTLNWEVFDYEDDARLWLSE